MSRMYSPPSLYVKCVKESCRWIEEVFTQCSTKAGKHSEEVEEEEEVGYKWGVEIYVLVKLGYSLFYGALPVPPASTPALCTLNYPDIYADTKTHRIFPCCYFHPKFFILRSLHHPFPILPTLQQRGVCAVRLSTLLTSTTSLSPSPSLSLSPSSQSVRLYLVFQP